MPSMTKRAFALAAGFFIAVLAVVHTAPSASAQTGEGWITLLDGTNMGDWDRVGETNWRLEDGAVVADKRTSKTPAHLVSKQSYKDFMIHAEFWASDDASRQVTVVLNGTQTAELTQNEMFTEGPITLQHGAGTIKFRKVAIKPL